MASGSRLIISHGTHIGARNPSRAPLNLFTRPNQHSRRPSESPEYRYRDWRTRAAGESPFADDGSDNDDVSVDIDQLAARLAAEAEKLRLKENQTSSEGGGLTDDDIVGADTINDAQQQQSQQRQPAPLQGDSLFGTESQSQADVSMILASIGDGGFYASEFELIQELGQISIQQVEAAPEDSVFPLSVERSSRAAVIAYTASYFSGMPFQDPVVTLIKEYLPAAKSVACNELQILKHLCGMPDETGKWRAAAAPLSQSPPIVELLGYFLAGPSRTAVFADPASRTAADADTIWVVQKWEGMAPLALYPAAQQTSGLGLGRLFGGADSGLKQRLRMLRAITRGCLRALIFCHSKGVVHGSVGSGSFLLSTFDDQDAMRLVVKLDNFGFARQISMPQTNKNTRRGVESDSGEAEEETPLFSERLPIDDSPLALGKRTDTRQLAVVLLECFLSALSANGPSDSTSCDAVTRVLGEVMDWDIVQFKGFCEDDGDLDQATAFLGADDGAGWELLQGLVTGEVSPEELLQGRFCYP